MKSVKQVTLHLKQTELPHLTKCSFSLKNHSNLSWWWIDCPTYFVVFTLTEDNSCKAPWEISSPLWQKTTLTRTHKWAISSRKLLSFVVKNWNYFPTYLATRLEVISSPLTKYARVPVSNDVPVNKIEKCLPLPLSSSSFIALLRAKKSCLKWWEFVTLKLKFRIQDKMKPPKEENKDQQNSSWSKSQLIYQCIFQFNASSKKRCQVCGCHWHCCHKSFH